MSTSLNTISIFNVKGGVGKTTLTILTAMYLSKLNKKVLIIDGDFQANTTQFIHNTLYEGNTMFEALAYKTKADDIIIKSPLKEFSNIDLIGSKLECCVLGELLVTETNREKAVYRWFAKNIDILSEYDYILIDLSPSYDVVTRNFLLISDSIITPLEYQDIASIRGCNLFYTKLKEDLEKLEIDNDVKKAIVVNRYTSRKLSTGDEFNNQLEKYEDMKKVLLNTRISEGTVVKNAILNKTDIEEYCKKIKKAHKVRGEFKNFMNELFERGIL